MKLSLVVPCYNEEDNVEKFYRETEKVFKGKIDAYEYVFIDDGSHDKTLEKLKKLYNENKDNSNIQVLSFSRNFGKEAAIFAGLQNAQGDLICLIDADLQQRPEVVLQMLEIIENNNELDCVTAYQKKRKENILMSSVKSAFYKLINKIAEVDFVNGASDFRLMRRCMADALISMSEYHRFSKGMFSWVGFKNEYISYDVAERENGTSKWGTRKLIKYALEGICAFSTAPLRISAYIGFISSLISVIYLVVVVVQKLFFGINVPGYATTVVLILFVGGVQMFCMGIIGEYLSKIYVQVKNRPIYILKEHIGKEK
ncbi:MAG: glycosyltransferase family 2 protein [Acetobacter sp.]|nr:glycosyltransferase family 2 protein [Bacteroides sp.]MCM1340740.1 glycosyltransferase family 2 protein [Acetobacter sp.]MCM1433077.1 glycosyltransferase family 2 protein [Clostridiales bacterium]